MCVLLIIFFLRYLNLKRPLYPFRVQATPEIWEEMELLMLKQLLLSLKLLCKNRFEPYSQIKLLLPLVGYYQVFLTMSTVHIPVISEYPPNPLV